METPDDMPSSCVSILACISKGTITKCLTNLDMCGITVYVHVTLSRACDFEDDSVQQTMFLYRTTQALWEHAINCKNLGRHCQASRTSQVALSTSNHTETSFLKYRHADFPNTGYCILGIMMLLHK